MTASIASTLPLRSQIFSVASCKSFMGAPFVGIGGIEKLPLSNAWGARPFSTHRHQVRGLGSVVGHLPVDQAARGKVRGPWGIGAVGGLLFHGCSLSRRACAVHDNKAGDLL